MIRSGQVAIFAFGEILYKDTDASQVTRCTKYRLYHGGDSLAPEGKFAIAKEGNTTDKNCEYSGVSASPIIDNPEINFVPAQDRLILINKGEKDFWLFGDKLGDEINFTGPTVMVPKGGFYYLLTNKLNEWALANIGQNGERLVPFEMYFMDEAKTHKFIGKFNLLIVVNNNVVYDPYTDT